MTGIITTVQISDPGAGNQFSFTVPTGVEMEILSMYFELATDGNAANRHVAVLFDDGANRVFMLQMATVVTSNSSETYAVGQGVPRFNGSGTHRHYPIPNGLEMAHGFRVRSSIVNLQAGDALTSIAMLVRMKTARTPQ